MISPAHPRQFADTNFPKRRRPAKGLLIHPHAPTIVFMTVCAKDREPWLATNRNHDLLRSIWSDPRSWLVGRYVLMPDHLHLFCAPIDPPLPLGNWVRYWKSAFSRSHGAPGHRWQNGQWDTRLRREESYDSKWHYVRNNPVRAGLVEDPDAWPYEGEINLLPW